MITPPDIHRLSVLATIVFVTACVPDKRPERTTPSPNNRTKVFAAEEVLPAEVVRAAEERFGLAGPVADISDGGSWMDGGTHSWELTDWEGNRTSFSMTGWGSKPPHTFYWGTPHPNTRPGLVLPQGSVDEQHLQVLIADWLNRTLCPEEVEFFAGAREHRFSCEEVSDDRCELAACGFVIMSTSDRFTFMNERIVGRQ
jgi:hypothetical protein